MFGKQEARTIVYPVLGGWLDLWFARLFGHGLGNSFYSYFHAVALAERLNAVIVAPAWFSLKIGPLLRGEGSKRFYWRMFRPLPGEVRGLPKFFTLLVHYRRRVIVEIGGSSQPSLVSGALNAVTCRKFTFHGLHAYRDVIRQRLLGIVRHAVPPGHCWGQGGHIAAHVRLGDFQVADLKVVRNNIANKRIPLSWYVNVVRTLRQRYPDKPAYVFSDGKEHELQPLLELGAKLYRSGSDITDLLMMSAASIFVGSNSTYSRWAAFLGNMLSIWLKHDVEQEKPSAPDTAILYVPIEDTEPDLWVQDV
jgi:hypothetical protein